MLTQSLKQEIQKSYSRFLESKELKPRYGQKLMIAEIARCLGQIEMDAEGHRINQAGICAIEAGTGTGKTVAYILAAIPVAKALGKKVVVSTATVALQEQILNKDLPDILRHSGLDFRFALAKGRGRYLCLSKLDLHLNSDQQQETLFGMDMPAEDSSTEAVQIYETMAKALLTSDWDGDKDSWPEELDEEVWSGLTSDRNQCSGRRCQHVAQCSFIKARDDLGSVDCIVANHDLVMADLSLGGGAILPEPEETIYIFDEAHHISDISLRHFTHMLRLHATLSWVDQASRVIKDIAVNYPSYNELQNRLDGLPSLLTELKQGYSELKPIVEGLVSDLVEDFSGQIQLPHYRFDKGEIPANLLQLAAYLSQRLKLFLDDATAAHDVVSASLEENTTGFAINQLEQLYAALGQIVNSADRQLGLWLSYSKPLEGIPDSRWVQIVEAGGLLDFELSASPVLASGVLQQCLWNRAFAAVMTSATITALNSFNRFQYQTGLPDYAATAVVPSPFDYANRVDFVVPELSVEPTDAQGHSELIADSLSGLVEGHQGVLVLFSSRRQMQDVHDMLDADLQDRVMCQSFMSKHKILMDHRQKIDEGEQSIIFGLASFAEGVDLPGEYCTHVIIAKLPFAVPDDPVNSALAEWMEEQGKNAFMEINLPEASQRLVQACGRLIRTEHDQGVITLLDKRIITKRYGRSLLEALPPFRRHLPMSR